MLVSLTMNLFPVEEAILPPTMGHYVYAAFLDILNRIDSKIADRLHSDRQCKPFTVSPLQGRFDKLGRDKILVKSGTDCWIRFTILEDDLLACMSRFFLESEFSTIRLGNNTFQITKISTDENGMNNNWSSCSTFEEILDRASPFDRLSIRFYSPTAFKIHSSEMDEQSYVFPDQLHCFQSWLRKWNALSPFPFNTDPLLDFVQKYIHFSRYSIKTKMMNFGRYKQLGFVGSCEYQFSNGKTEHNKVEILNLLKQADALACFAFYCGTGYKTTMGMGQTRKEDFAD